MRAEFAFAFNFFVASSTRQFSWQIFRDGFFKVRKIIGEYFITQNDQWKCSGLCIGLCAGATNGLLGEAGIRLKQLVNQISHIQVTLRSVKKIV